MIRRLVLIIAGVLSLSLAGQSYCLGADKDGLDVKRKALSNGLVVLHVERENLPLVMASLLVKAGPLNEDAQKAGLSNLTASLLREGTKSKNSAEISSEVDFIGAGLGASAGDDFTTVSLSVLKKDIEKGFELFSDILLNPAFTEEEIKRKKALIKGGLRQKEEDPEFVAGKAFQKEVYGEHPYGRLVTGTEETIDNITRDDITGFHAAYFVPNNSMLTVVGDITEAELNALIYKHLDGWERKEIPERKEIAIKAPEKKVVKLEKDLTQANIILGHIGITRDNPDYYAVSVMNYILGGGGFSSRLMSSIRDEMGLAYDVHSFFSSNKEPGVFEAGVQTKNEYSNRVIAEILRQIKRITEEDVADAELEEAKSYLTGSFPRRIDTMRKIADFLSAVEFYGLGLDYIEKYPGYIIAVTKEDIKRVAQKYLRPEGYVLVVVGRQEEAKVDF
jgi:zinc protease